MPRKPKADATEYLRRLLTIPVARPMTGHEVQRLDFAKAVLEFVIKDPPSRKQMSEFIQKHARDNGILPKVCYSTLKALKDQTVAWYDEDFKVYRYNRHRYHRDLTALKAFNEKVKAWKASNFRQFP